MAARKTVKITGKKGQKPLTFKSGGLHAATNTPAGETIPQAKMDKALAGDYGPKAKRQANFAVNVLKQGQRTAAKNRRKKKKGA